MKYSILLFALLFALYSCDENKTAQTKTIKPIVIKNDSLAKLPDSVFFKMHDYTLNADSVKITSTGKFGEVQYPGDPKKHPAFICTLKITNKAQAPVPTVQTARKGKLHIVINGNPEAMAMTLANFAMGEDQVIAKDSSDTWNFDVTLDNSRYGKEKFTFQWIYMDIPSVILEADPIKHTVKEVKKHLPDHLSRQ